MNQEGPQKPPGSIVPLTPSSGHILDQAGVTRGILERVFSDLQPNTLRAYQHAWDIFAEYLGVPSRLEAAAHITTLSGGEANAAAMDWISGMMDASRDARAKGEKGIGAATIALRLAALKGIAKRLRIVGLITWAIEIKGPQVNRYKDTAGPGTQKVVEVVEMLRARTDPKGVRDLALIHCLYTTGLRRGELVSLLLPHVELEKSRVSIIGKARDDEEWITLPGKAKEAIEAWLKVRPGTSKHLFVSLDPHSYGNPLSDNGLWKITTSYGLGRPHGIRHSGITRVLDKSGGNIRMAQEFSRHKDPRTLMLYDDNRKDLAGEASKLLDDDL